MVRRLYFAFALIAPIVIVGLSFRFPNAWWAFLVVGPLIALGVHDVLQTKHSLLRVFPIIGHGRHLMEELRPGIQQYFVESNVDGMPFSREMRSAVYQRAKGEIDTLPFGTQRDVDRDGYEWMSHSMAPKPVLETDPRVEIGGATCKLAYRAAHLNVSAMSFGSLSSNAILALNAGAKTGGFYHNTGEGGLSPYHLKPGGDLVWQIGTGYFGCRGRDGGFDPNLFAEASRHDAVRMIEIKISQGAKPAHGGILPAEKLSREIAEIRGVPMGQDVISPPAHRMFSTPHGLVEFIARLRELSGGKPVGFKLCVGHKSEFLGICKAMVATGIHPDFITVDGTEGGTGAAPVELSNSVGMPFRQGLWFVNNALRGVGFRDRVRVVAAGKIVTGFHLFRAVALGADLCNSARPMMFALGCIQARQCNTNTCPVGVATQNPAQTVGLVPADKGPRVARYQAATVKAFLDMVSAAGLEDPCDIRPFHVDQRVAGPDVQSFAKLYPWMPDGFLMDESVIPKGWRRSWAAANVDHF